MARKVVVVCFNRQHAIPARLFQLLKQAPQIGLARSDFDIENFFFAVLFLNSFILEMNVENAPVVFAENFGDVKARSGGVAGIKADPDAFVARLNTTGTSTTVSTSTSSYLGGSGKDVGTSIALEVPVDD